VIIFLKSEKYCEAMRPHRISLNGKSERSYIIYNNTVCSLKAVPNNLLCMFRSFRALPFFED